VQALTYQGSYPVAKLTPSTLAEGVHADLFAFSTYSIGDMEASARPMAAFTLAVSTGATWAAGDVFSFMMNLPTAIEPDMIRNGTALGPATPMSSSTACLRSCNTNPACSSWNFNKTLSMCRLQKDAPNVFYALGNDCGLRGGWTYDKISQCLTLDRSSATGGSNGNMSLCSTVSGAGSPASSALVSYGTYDEASGAFVDLGSSGTALNGDISGANGAIAVSAKLAPLTNATLTITFGWYFPERDHFGKIFGNYYRNLFESSADAAFGNVAPEQRGDALAAVVTDVLAMQGPFHSSSLEPWLQDHLVNSLSHIRTAMWFDSCPDCHKSNDTRLQTAGFWRQWEAFDCPDIDSIHNDGERHIPYLMFWPNTTRNKLAAWAGNQQPNGMLAEQIHGADPDKPEGREMADSSSMFICYVLELLRWSGDRQTLGLYWPTVKRAAEWQMNVSSRFGVPLKLQTTYDILGFTQYELNAYGTVFHILAMAAAANLAAVVGDSASATRYSEAATRATTSLDTLQWVEARKWNMSAGVFCPARPGYDDGPTSLGPGFNTSQCKAACTGGCTSMVLSTDGHGRCYLCTSDVVANTAGFNLYTNDGTVEGSWAAASDSCTDRDNCTRQHGMFGDALYAQVLAYTAGLGTIVSSKEKLTSHLAAELASNCAHAEGERLVSGCDKAGIVILTGRPKVGSYDWQIWEGAAPNHATLALRTGESPTTALANFKKSTTSWIERVNDQWNTAGIKDSDGYPTVTSHYGFHMVSWHVPLAMSGQLADLTSPTNRSLTFAPRLQPPFSLPIMLPGVLGTVGSSVAGKYTVCLTVGEIELDLLSVDGNKAPGSPVRLVANKECVDW
jgi:hypothetical protein